MTREAIKGLLIAIGLALLMLFSVVLPLDAAPSQYPHPQETGDVALEITAAPSTTVTAGQNLTLTATLRNGQPISITNVNLMFMLPLTTITSTTPLTRHWDSLEPSVPVTSQVLLLVPSQVSGTLQFTATLQYVITETLLISDSIEVVVVLPEALAPTATVTHSPAPSSTPTEATVPIITPTETPAPTTTPSPFDRAMTFASKNKPLVAAICTLSLLLLGLLLILWPFRRKKPRPKPTPPPPPPPPMPTAPHLESIGTSGGPRRFDLKPDGLTIGRAPENGLVITQDFPGWESVSRRHARVYQQAGNWIVEDL
ncbi:MAG: hypothetical protein DRI37_06725, partial [Chloroflexi bacterium]